MATYGDYRRVLDRKDVDAVLIATPDHWHSQMTVDGCGAGKDIYIDKPLSNTIPAARRMLAAVLKYQRVAQVGMQQPSWPHFQKFARMIRDGVLGLVTHTVIHLGGGYYTGSPAPPARQLGLLFGWEGPEICGKPCWTSTLETEADAAMLT